MKLKVMLSIMSFVMFTSTSFAMGSKLPEGQVRVSGTASQTVAYGAPVCNNLSLQAESSMRNSCASRGAGAVIIKSDKTSCSCSTSNDRMFSKCTAVASGVCQIR